MLVAIIILAFILFVFYVCRMGISNRPQYIIPELKNNEYILLYRDINTEKYFESKQFKIRAKPDFLYQLDDGSCLLVEYKSRTGKVKDSDIAQLIATALAVKESYPSIQAGYIYTQSKDIKRIDLSLSIDQLEEMISKEINDVRQIQKGIRPTFLPDINKCKVCVFKESCDLRKFSNK